MSEVNTRAVADPILRVERHDDALRRPRRHQLDLSFQAANEGDITALSSAPNGAGKTTVFNCITGFYKPSEGRIGLRHGSADFATGLDVATARDTASTPHR